MKRRPLSHHYVLLGIQILTQFASGQSQNEMNVTVCPDGWTYYRKENMCIIIMDKKILTTRTREACKNGLDYSKFGGLVTREDVDLITINDEETNTFVYNYGVNIAKKLKNKDGGYTIGLYDTVNGDYRWFHTGEAMSYSNWGRFQPNTEKDENYTVMLYDKNAWHDVGPLQTWNPACELIGADPCVTNNTDCGNSSLCITQGVKNYTCQRTNDDSGKDVNDDDDDDSGGSMFGWILMLIIILILATLLVVYFATRRRAKEEDKLEEKQENEENEGNEENEEAEENEEKEENEENQEMESAGSEEVDETNKSE